MPVSNDWKSTSFREDAIYMLRITFLPTMTDGIGCITENYILRKKRHEEQNDTYCYYYYTEL